MEVIQINRGDLGIFSQQQIDMCYNQSKYADFINLSFSEDHFEQQIELKKSFPSENRITLVESIKEQYHSIDIHPKVQGNIEKLAQENTFTVCTGHQLVALTGPLYFIYKIAHTIRLCEALSKKHPQNQFVPVYWMATEDHDYEEIKSLHLFNQTLTWESEETGPVGRFGLNGMDELLRQIKDLFQNHPNSEVFDWLNQVNGSSNYADAFRKLVNFLFQHHGLIILDGDDRRLKKIFAPMMKKDVTTQFSNQAVRKTTDKLVQLGGKEQVHAREINMFYIDKGVRERLILEHNRIQINQLGNFSLDEVCEMIDMNPQQFSPNVILRPLYQEQILPNLCYVGGAGEINYWLQLKGVFDEVNTVFPLLKTRNSLLWVDATSLERINQLNLKPTDFLKESHQIVEQFVSENTGDEISFELIDETLNQLQMEMITLVNRIEPSMDSFAQAESVRLEKSMSQFKDKLYKSLKSKHDKKIKQIYRLKETLFPANSLQERYVNVLQLAPTGNIVEKVDEIVRQIQAFSDDFLLVVED